jgi:CheY-like chemotaxis protein
VTGHGAIFHFTIQAPSVPSPIFRSAGVSETDVDSREPDYAPLRGRRALVVDDNATNRSILLRYAEKWEMEATPCASGAEALAAVQTGQAFDLAILDMCMPEMDGMALAAALRKLPATRTLPLVMLTSLDRQHQIHKHAAAQFAAIFNKPVKPNHLLNVLVGLYVQPAAVKTPELPTQVGEGRGGVAPYPALGQIHPLRLLLAEDNTVNQKVALHTLKRIAYTADVAANGLEVLAALERQTYDVVLMDVQMPEMDGVEAVRAIRDQWPSDAQPYVIAMTTHAMSGDRQRFLEAGMDDYVSKPFSLEELAAALARAAKTH